MSAPIVDVEPERVLRDRAKAVLRKQMRGICTAIGEQSLQVRFNALKSHLLSDERIQGAATLVLYRPLDRRVHPDLSTLAEQFRSMGKVTAYPHFNATTQSVSCRRVDDESLLIDRGFPTAEAADSAPLVEIGPGDLILLPVLAVDSSGHFISDGSGFYDCVLRSFSRVGSFAVAFEFQIIPEASMTAEDEKVGYIATDLRVFEARFQEAHARPAIEASGFPRAAKEVRGANDCLIDPSSAHRAGDRLGIRS